MKGEENKNGVIKKMGMFQSFLHNLHTFLYNFHNFFARF